jgi:sulfopyruvate decarboxylase subunit beta
MSCESRIIGIMKQCGVDYVLTVPCDRVKSLIARLPDHFRHIPLTREEEGVGICAGLAMCGKKPLMLIQNSGVGNMINALCSLTKVYELPLPLLLSWRGIYNENIVAQVPMGKYLPDIFEAIEARFELVGECTKVPIIEKVIQDAYSNNEIYAALLSPRIWECGGDGKDNAGGVKKKSPSAGKSTEDWGKARPLPSLTRSGLLREIAPALEKRLVVSNIGTASKELYSISDQPSNFYMLGSFGLASAVGLGFALGTKKDVVVLDGDGSILTNPGTLCTIAQESPKNLAVICMDNGVHGATGNQPTAASKFIDLEQVARSMGIKNTVKAVTGDKVAGALSTKIKNGPLFVHAVLKPGNEKLPEIPLSPPEIKKRVIGFLNE